MIFDGWHILKFPINIKSPVKVHGPCDKPWQCARDGESGNGQVDAPICVSGVCVGSFTFALNILEMAPTVLVIEIRDLMVL